MTLIEFGNGRAIKESQAMQVREGIRDVIVMPVDLANPVHWPRFPEPFRRDRSERRLYLFSDAFSSRGPRLRSDQVRILGRAFMEMQAGMKGLYQSIAPRSQRSAHPDEHHPPSAIHPCIFDVQPLARMGNAV